MGKPDYTDLNAAEGFVFVAAALVLPIVVIGSVLLAIYLLVS